VGFSHGREREREREREGGRRKNEIKGCVRLRGK
jgi:hypothetical protein